MFTVRRGHPYGPLDKQTLQSIDAPCKIKVPYDIHYVRNDYDLCFMSL